MKLVLPTAGTVPAFVHPLLRVSFEDAEKMVPKKQMVKVMFQPYSGNISYNHTKYRDEVIKLMNEHSTGISRSGIIGQMSRLGIHLSWMGYQHNDEILTGDLFIETDPAFMIQPREILSIEAQVRKDTEARRMQARYEEAQGEPEPGEKIVNAREIKDDDRK